MKFIPATARTFPPAKSEGWTISFIERESRYWIEAKVGFKEQELFEQGVHKALSWAQPTQSIRWFTDGEKRYSIELWKLASIYLSPGSTPFTYPYRKVWREGVEVALKIKLSQGGPKVEWVKAEHRVGKNCTNLTTIS